MSESTKQDLFAFLQRTCSLIGKVWASSARLQIPSNTALSTKLILGRLTPESVLLAAGYKCVLQVSHVFMSLVEPGFAVLTNKQEPGQSPVMQHLVTPSLQQSNPLLLESELVVQAPEQIMINTALWMKLTT